MSLYSTAIFSLVNGPLLLNLPPYSGGLACRTAVVRDERVWRVGVAWRGVWRGGLEGRRREDGRRLQYLPAYARDISFRVSVLCFPFCGFTFWPNFACVHACVCRRVLAHPFL